MTATELALMRMIAALCALVDVDPYDLAMRYLNADERQAFFDKFASLTADD